MIYSSGIVAYGDMLLMMRQAAQFILQNPTGTSFLSCALHGDVIHFASDNDTSRKSHELARRLDYLDDSQLAWLAGDDLALSKQVNLYCVFRRDRLFYEFMREVYCSLHLTFVGRVNRGDVMSFMNRKAVESEKVAHWTDYIRKRLGTEYFRILARSGYGVLNDDDSLTIAIPHVSSVFTDDLKEKGQPDMAYALNGGRK